MQGANRPPLRWIAAALALAFAVSMGMACHMPEDPGAHVRPSQMKSHSLSVLLKVHARALTSPRVQGFVLSQFGQARRGSTGLSRRDPGTRASDHDYTSRACQGITIAESVIRRISKADTGVRHGVPSKKRQQDTPIERITQRFRFLDSHSDIRRHSVPRLGSEVQPLERIPSFQTKTGFRV